MKIGHRFDGPMLYGHKFNKNRGLQYPHMFTYRSTCKENPKTGSLLNIRDFAARLGCGDEGIKEIKCFHAILQDKWMYNFVGVFS